MKLSTFFMCHLVVAVMIVEVVECWPSTVCSESGTSVCCCHQRTAAAVFVSASRLYVD